MKKKNNTLKYALIGIAIIVVLLVIGKSMGWFGKEVTLKVAVEKPENIGTESLTYTPRLLLSLN